MDPITIAATTKIVTYLAEKAFEEAFDTTVGEFTKDSINWLKSIFLKDGTPNETLKNLREKPDSSARQNAAKALIELELEDNPDAQKYLLEIVKTIDEKAGNKTTISRSKNVNTGTIHSGGNIIFGDNNH